MNTLHVKKDDEVIVISGNDKGKRGKVISVSPSERKVLVSGVHIVKKHQKPRRQGETGQFLEVEGAIYADKVALYCPECKAGRRSKVSVGKDGKKIRVCAKCGAKL